MLLKTKIMKWKIIPKIYRRNRFINAWKVALRGWIYSLAHLNLVNSWDSKLIFSSRNVRFIPLYFERLFLPLFPFLSRIILVCMWIVFWPTAQIIDTERYKNLIKEFEDIPPDAFDETIDGEEYLDNLEGWVKSLHEKMKNKVKNSSKERTEGRKHAGSLNRIAIISSDS